jgi:hypothetical protein
MLLDKNGLEIYFGDVVRFNGIINHEHSAEISYDFTVTIYHSNIGIIYTVTLIIFNQDLWKEYGPNHGTVQD